MTASVGSVRQVVGPASRPGRRRWRLSNQRGRTLSGWLFISPWVIGFLAFTLYPFLASLYYSFTDYDIVHSPKWIGFANYRNLFTDHLFWTSLFNTAYYAVFEIPLSAVLAIGLALLLNMKVKGLAIYRTIFYLPSVVPLVASSILWLWLFNPAFGIINDILADAHIPGRLDVLGGLGEADVHPVRLLGPRRSDGHLSRCLTGRAEGDVRVIRA